MGRGRQGVREEEKEVGRHDLGGGLRTEDTQVWLVLTPAHQVYLRCLSFVRDLLLSGRAERAERMKMRAW